MTRIAGLVIALALLVLTQSTLLAQTTAAAKNPLIGVWKVVESQNGPVTDTSLYIFTARHFSRMAGAQSRAKFKDPAKVTAEEKVAAFDTFSANTGTYQVSGDSLVLDILLAKRPNNVGGKPKMRFKIEGTTLVWTNEDNKNFIKLTRVE